MPPAVAVCAKNLAWDRLSGAYAKGFASDCSSCVVALWQLLLKATARKIHGTGFRLILPPQPAGNDSGLGPAQRAKQLTRIDNSVTTAERH
jgi:hypothetical protein